MMIFGFMFPVLFILWLIFQEPKYRYYQRHYADEKHASPENEIVGYDMIDREIASFEANHSNGYGYKCMMLCGVDGYQNELDNRLPIDKREFLLANPDAAKLYKRCMTRHIAWSRGVIPKNLIGKWYKMDPYAPYYAKYGELEKQFYSHGTTIYEKNCICKPNNRENPYCKHCSHTQNKVAKSYIAQRLVDYNQKNVSTYGISTYPHAAAKTIGSTTIPESCSKEGLDTTKWNCIDKSCFSRIKYNANDLDSLKLDNAKRIYCPSEIMGGDKQICDRWCKYCKWHGCFDIEENRNIEF